MAGLFLKGILIARTDPAHASLYSKNTIMMLVCAASLGFVAGGAGELPPVGHLRMSLGRLDCMPIRKFRRVHLAKQCFFASVPVADVAL